LQRQTTQALVLWLEANGYHRHHGEWRRRREHS
jgi:hypothetical protein